MSSAYKGVSSAPEGLSVIAVKPFHGTPASYPPSSFCTYNTPFLTPVSNKREPTSSQTIFVILFPPRFNNIR